MRYHSREIPFSLRKQVLGVGKNGVVKVAPEGKEKRQYRFTAAFAKYFGKINNSKIRGWKSKR